MLGQLDHIKFKSINMKKKTLLLFFGIILSSFQLLADSPLTSIQFWSKDDGAMVIKASKSNGKINNNIINYLLNSKNLEVKKLILVNALGWKFHSENNSIKFQKALFKKYQVSTLGDLRIKAKPFDLSLYAYILGLDNYFDVKKAKEIAEYAEIKGSGFGTRYVFKLLEAQDNLSIDHANNIGNISPLTGDEKPAIRYRIKVKPLALPDAIVVEFQNYIGFRRQVTPTPTISQSMPPAAIQRGCVRGCGHGPRRETL